MLRAITSRRTRNHMEKMNPSSRKMNNRSRKSWLWRDIEEPKCKGLLESFSGNTQRHPEIPCLTLNVTYPGAPKTSQNADLPGRETKGTTRPAGGDTRWTRARPAPAPAPFPAPRQAAVPMWGSRDRTRVVTALVVVLAYQLCSQTCAVKGLLASPRLTSYCSTYFWNLWPPNKMPFCSIFRVVSPLYL